MNVRTWLRCARCGRETPHDIRYAGRVMRSASCVACGLETELQGRSDCLSDMSLRLRTKPKRIARELCSRPQRLLTIPRRVVSKPSRVGQEVREVIR
jgi:hypothetical protein